MRELIDWLADHVEPYVSFRYMLGIVFSAMFFQWLVSNALWLRDAARSRATASPREQLLTRIGRKYAGVILLRAFSSRNVREHAALIAQIVVLTAASIALVVYVFAHGA